MKQRLAITALAFACACSSYAQSPANPPSRPQLDQLDMLCLPFMAKRGTAEQLGRRARVFGYTDKLDNGTQSKNRDYNPVRFANASRSIMLTFVTNGDGTPRNCSIHLGVNNATLQAPLRAWAKANGLAENQALVSAGGGQGNNDAEYYRSNLRVFMEGTSQFTILSVDDKPEKRYRANRP